MDDPVLRNRHITRCYAQLSAALSSRTGPLANWCTFAAWASSQAGQSIRKEDLLAALRGAVALPSDVQATRLTGAALPAPAFDRLRRLLPQALDLRLAVDRSAGAVARGNKKVFDEIGHEFARFLAAFLSGTAPDPDKLAAFCDSLRPGDPPDGQEYLRRAFTRYYRAFFTGDPKARLELVLAANIEIGFHEQTRLQPEIAEALDAPYADVSAFARRLLGLLFPASGWLAFSRWAARRLLGRPTPLDRLIELLHQDGQLELRLALSEMMMTLRLPPGRVLRLGDDLAAAFPASLQALSDPDLVALVSRFDPDPGSLVDSGARDWASLPDRLHFIVDLFRCYALSSELFAYPPGTEPEALPENDPS